MLATFEWIGGTAGNAWQAATNWRNLDSGLTGDGVPGSADTATLNGGPNVLLTSNVQVGSLHIESGYIDRSILTQNWTLTFGGGTVRGGQLRGTFTNTGALTIAAPSGAQTTADGAILLWGNLQNLGTIHHVSGNLLTSQFLSPIGHIANAAEGVYELSESAGLLNLWSVGTFDNAGILRKMDDHGAAYISTKVINQPTGRIEVAGGTLTLSGPEQALDGAVQIQPDARLDFDLSNVGCCASGTVNLNGDLTLSGGGRMRLRRGAAHVNGTLHATDGIFEVLALDAEPPSSATLRGFGTLAGNVEIRRGRIGVASFGSQQNSAQLTNVGVLSFLGDTEFSSYLSGSTIVNEGTLVIRGAAPNAFALEGAHVENRSGGQFEFQADADVNGAFGNGVGPGTLRNAGTLRVAEGVSLVTLPGVTFRNAAEGTLDIRAGTLDLRAIRNWDSVRTSGGDGGHFVVAPNAILDWRNANAGPGVPILTGIYTGAGGGRVLFGNNTFDAATLDEPTGMFRWEGGRLHGSLENHGQLTIPQNVEIVGALTNRGTLDVEPGVSIVMQVPLMGEGRINNAPGGLLRLHGNAAFQFGMAGTIFDNRNPLIVNQGTIAAAAGVVTIGPKFENQGTVETRGTITATNPRPLVYGVDQVGLPGTWIALDGGRIQFPNSASFFNALDGQIILRGAGSVFTGLEELRRINGALTLSEGGALAIDGSLTNAGLIVVGPASTLNLPAYEQTSVGQLTTLVGGSESYGRLLVTGDAQLAGSLRTELVNDFQPLDSERFDVVLSRQITGDFASYDLHGLTAALTPTKVTLGLSTAASDLEVSAVTLLGAGSTLLPGQTFQVQYTVSNRSGRAATGPWTDLLHFSFDRQLGPTDIVLARSAPTLQLPPFASVTLTETVVVPNRPGSGYVFVAADAAGAVLDLNRRNNIAASATRLTIAATPLPLGQDVSQSWGTGETQYFALTIPAGSAPIRVTAQFAASDAGELRVRRGELPVGNIDDHVSNAALSDNARRAIVDLPDTIPGIYYLAVTSRTGGSVTIRADEQALSISGLTSESSLSSQWIAGDTLTLTLHGAGFTPATQFSLGTLPASSAEIVNPQTAIVTFGPLAAGGPFALRATRGTSVVEYTRKLFTVIPQSNDVAAQWARLANWIVTVNLPAYSRPLRELRATITFRNASSVSQPAPIVQVVTDNGKLRFPSDTSYGSSTLLILGVKSNGRPDRYAPGESNSFDVILFPETHGAHVTTGVAAAVIAEQRVTPQRGAGLAAGIPPLSEEIPLASHGLADLRPNTISTQAWNEVVLPNLQRLVGGTVSSYAQTLRDAAAALAPDRVETQDVSRLMTYLIRLADQFGALSRRFELTAFGRGVENPFDQRAIVDSAGNVLVQSGFAVRPFYKSGPRFVASDGDLGQLAARPGGGFTLTETDGSMTLFSAAGLWEQSRDRLGRTTTPAYSTGRLTSIVDPIGDTTQLTYNAAGRITAITDAVGRVTTFAYDASNERLTSVSTPSGTTTFTLNPQQTGPLAYTIQSQTGPDGIPLALTYDSFGRVAQRSLGAGQLVSSFAYGAGNQLGRVTISDNTGRTASVQQGEFGQVSKATSARGDSVDFEFDALGRIARIASAAGKTQFDRNAAGRATSVLNSSGYHTRITYDASGLQPMAIADHQGHVTSSIYDERAFLSEQLGPDGASEYFAHDSAGALVFFRSVGGRMVRDTLNAKQLVTRREFSDGSRLDFAYDSRRNLVTVTETPLVGSPRTVSFEYDPADRITRITYPDGRFVSYRYDSAGRRDRMSASPGLVFDYEFDALGRLASIRRDGVAQVTYSYDIAGRLATKSFANGASTRYQYDLADRITRVEHRGAGDVPLDFQEYEYSSRGLVAAMTDQSGTTRYDYDAEGQLVSATLPDHTTLDYGVDALGNRVGYTVNERQQYLKSPSGDSFAYDADGNLTRVVPADESAPTIFRYDGRGRLSSVTNAAGTWQFEYNPLGQRSAIIKDGVRTDLLLDALGGADGLADVLAEFHGSTQTASYLLGDGVEARFDSLGAPSYYHFDAQGNTLALTNAAGAVSASYRYLPFGELASQTGPAASSNPFTFQGQWGVADRGGGLYDMRARFYDSALGRFTQPDPIGLAGGDVNLQRFALNNPLHLIDPSGTTFAPLGVPIPNPFSYTTLEAFGATSLLIESVVENPGVNLPAIRPGPMPAFLEGAAEAVVEESLAEGAVLVEQTLGGGAATLSGGTLALGGLLLLPALLAGSEIANYHAEQHEASKAGPPPTIQSDTVQKIIETQSKLHPSFKTLVDLYREEHNGEDPSLDTILLWLESIRAGEQALDDARNEQLTPEDPNEIVGPAGVGPNGFLRPVGTFPYTIYFQNKPTAAAPAQEVFVTQQLDSDLNWDSFELGAFGWGDESYDVPAGRRNYQTRIEYPERGLVVEVSAAFDAATGRLQWSFRSLDPIGLDLTSDPFAGFLPPDDASGRGQGFVSYRIQPQAGAVTGTRYDAQATIVFDSELPLNTPPIYHTADVGAPHSAVQPLPGNSPTSSFLVTWASADDATGATGSGVVAYDVYVSENDGPYLRWLAGVSATSAMYAGYQDSSYAFFSVARDAVGIVEEPPVTADARTHVPRRNWHNDRIPLDVVPDDVVAPIDALVIINLLNATGSQVLPAPSEGNSPPPYYDVNDDGHASPIDALMVINELNRVAQGEGEAEGEERLVLGAPVAQVMPIGVDSPLGPTAIESPFATVSPSPYSVVGAAVGLAGPTAAANAWSATSAAWSKACEEVWQRSSSDDPLPWWSPGDEELDLTEPLLALRGKFGILSANTVEIPFGRRYIRCSLRNGNGAEPT